MEKPINKFSKKLLKPKYLSITKSGKMFLKKQSVSLEKCLQKTFQKESQPNNLWKNLILKTISKINFFLMTYLSWLNVSKIWKNFKYFLLKIKAMKTNKIQEGMLIFIVSFIKNTEDDAILWKCFNKLDINRDGSISRE